MANRLQTLDTALKKCYDQDLDWSLLPARIREICGLLGKGMKQRDTTVFLGLMCLVSFCMGHACVQVHEFWSEPIILWMAVVLPTGRCKSTFHHFLNDVLDKVNKQVQEQGSQAKPMQLPHCTWDKFGDILANSGARSIGLFDELVSFFSTMNMYSASKLQVSDTKEYQDFLQMYTGKAKTRETVTGNANFKMNQTSFTLVGFTQPQSALPIIEDLQNNAKGFTSRLLWWFPKPVFCKMRDTMLDDIETEEVRTFLPQLVKFLTQLYIKGEDTYTIEDEDKMTSVEVDRKKFILSPDAIDSFEKIHDEWELEICEKYPHDALVGGLYSRGKSHILRLAVPIQCLIGFCHKLKKETANPDDTSPEVEDDSSETGPGSQMADEIQQNLTIQKDNHDMSETIVTAEAIDVACSIVRSCLAQICALNGKSFINNALECPVNCEVEFNEPDAQRRPAVDAFKKILANVILIPGRIVSLTILNQKGMFRKNTQGLSGKPLMLKVVNDLPNLLLGKVETYTIPGNKSQVHFYVKTPVPDKSEEIITFIQRLASVGVNLEAYRRAYDTDHNESEKHLQDYNCRKQNDFRSPSKRPRQE